MNVNGLRVALQQLGFQLSVEICNQLFLKHDADRSGTIQLEEFRCIYQEVNQWVVGPGRNCHPSLCSTVLIRIILEKWSMGSSSMRCVSSSTLAWEL